MKDIQVPPFLAI